MNWILPTLLLITTASASPSEPIGNLLVDYINAAQSLYVAERNDLETKYSAMHSKFADPHPEQDIRMVAGEDADVILPLSFDSRTKWPLCDTMKLIRDQEGCGSCWAFSVAEVISDRTCIESSGNNRPVLSPEDILSCCGARCGFGCAGGWPVEALKWWNRNGVVTGGDFGGGGCEPYSIGPSGHFNNTPTPSCKLYCHPGYPRKYKDDKHHGRSVYGIVPKVNAIKAEIMRNGPVSATFQVFEDLYKYRHGIYHHVAGKKLGGHAVKIIGWGTENGVGYWIVANSWGRGFGERGFIRIRSGNNECGIESNVLAGRAKAFNDQDYARDSEESDELEFL